MFHYALLSEVEDSPRGAEDLAAGIEEVRLQTSSIQHVHVSCAILNVTCKACDHYLNRQNNSLARCNEMGLCRLSWT